MAIEALEGIVREKTGTAASNAARLEGKIPAVLYGHKEEAVALLVDGEKFSELFHGGTRILDLKVKKKTEHAMIKEVQYDHLGDRILNIDFTRVSETEKISVAVEIALHGTPAGVKEGGHLDQTMHEITVECLPKDIPERFDINVAELVLGGSLAVSDLELPAGVTTAIDPAQKIAIVHVPKAQVEEVVEEEEEGEEDSAEPEVLSQRKEKEEGEDDKGSKKGKD